MSSGPSTRSDDDVAEAIARLIRALGRRAAGSDPDFAKLLQLIELELRDAWAHAVAGWRQHGFTDTQIGRELGVTKQAIAQRWPRPEGGPR